MSVGQLLQPNSYTIYGNLNPTQSGNIDDDGDLIYEFPGAQDPVYAHRRTLYNVVGKCVTFQSFFNLITNGDGTGRMKWKLPDALPQGFVNLEETGQSISLTIYGLTDKDKYLDIWGTIDFNKDIDLTGRLSADGTVVSLIDTDIVDGVRMCIRGSYFTS